MPEKFDRFELEYIVGSGGTADVWKAVDPKREAAVALKIFRVSATAEARQRFLVEADISGMLTSRRVVRVHEAIEYRGRFALVLDLCAGSVGAWARRDGAIHPWWLARIGIEILHALEHAHARGVLHLDIKPENILLDLEGGIKLADFGVAQLLDHNSTMGQTSAMWGTLPFTAPERRLGREPNAGSDLYSLAATLAWLGTAGEAMGDLYVPQVLERLRVDLPHELVSCLQRASAYEPGERYHDARTMRKELEQLQAEWEVEPVPVLLGLGDSIAKLDTRGRSGVNLVDRRPRGWAFVAIAGPIAIVVSIASVVVAWRGGAGAPELETVPAESPLRSPDRGADTLLRCDDALDFLRSVIRMGPRETMAATALHIDDDERVDIIYTNQLDPSLTVYRGGAAPLAGERFTIDIPRSHARAIVGDVDGDGDLDLVTIHADSSSIISHLGDGDRAFNPMSAQFQAPAPLNAELVDWDEDGRLDLMMTLVEGEQCTAWRRGLGDGTFESHVCVGPASTLLQPFVVRPPGVVVRNRAGQFSLYRRSDQNRLRDRFALWDPGDLVPESVMHSTVRDLDGDGVDELYVVAARGSRHGILRVALDGAVPCWLVHDLPVPRRQFADLADVDGDGVVDVVARSTCAGCTSNHIVLVGWREHIEERQRTR